MKNENKSTTSFSINKYEIFRNSTLFHSNKNELDLMRDKVFIIAKIATYGNDEERNFMLEHYSSVDILFVVNNYPDITPIKRKYFNKVLSVEPI